MWESEQDQRLKVILSYIENWELPWAAQDPDFKKKYMKIKSKYFQFLVRLLTLNFTITRETHSQT